MVCVGFMRLGCLAGQRDFVGGEGAKKGQISSELVYLLRHLY